MRRGCATWRSETASFGGRLGEMKDVSSRRLRPCVRPESASVACSYSDSARDSGGGDGDDGGAAATWNSAMARVVAEAQKC